MITKGQILLWNLKIKYLKIREGLPTWATSEIWENTIEGENFHLASYAVVLLQVYWDYGFLYDFIY